MAEPQTRIHPRILHIDTTEEADGPVGIIRNLNDWTWRKTPTARWTYHGWRTFRGSDLAKAHLIIFCWPSDGFGSGDQRSERPKDRICKLWDSAGKPGTVIVLRSPDQNEAVIRASIPAAWHLLSTSADPRSAALDSLGTIWPHWSDYNLELTDENDPSMTRLFESFGQRRKDWLEPDGPKRSLSSLRSMGREHLAHLMQRFFPADRKVEVAPVGGGWSGDSLCRVYAGTGPQEHFVKFYSDKEKYEEEFKNHLLAKSTLGRYTVQVERVPFLGVSKEPQAEAFPAETKKPLYPICFVSASCGHPPRRTLKELYITASDSFIDEAIDKLLTIVPGPFDRKKRDPRAHPWGQAGANGIQLTDDMRRNVLDAIEDLKGYGAVCGDWRRVCELVENLMYKPLHKHYCWLTAPLSVALGYVHGDPNTRNCLFSPDDPQDLQLIDCGQFSQTGRLVSDLAIVERELKLMLLGTELASGGFLDLDPCRLGDNLRPQTWCDAERIAIAEGFDYLPEKHDAVFVDRSIIRAYRPIARVRARAKEASGRVDADGCHYFAALLYWTLDVLNREAVRRTKKLLALFSAAQILERFR